MIKVLFIAASALVGLGSALAVAGGAFFLIAPILPFIVGAVVALTLPIIGIVGGITALVVGLGLWAVSSSKAESKTSEMTKETDKAKDSIKDPWEYFNVNVLGQFNMLEAARHMGAKYLYLNSIKSHEHHPYGASKASAAIWARAYAETYDMPLVMNQVGNLYGPHGDNFWVNIFMQKAKDGEPIEVWGDGSSSRDMLYIEDLTDLLVDEIAHFDLYAKHEVIPVGGGADNVLSLKKVLDWLDYKNVTYKPEMTTLDKERVTDNTLVTSINGWRPVTTLDQGLKLTYDSINA